MKYLALSILLLFVSCERPAGVSPVESARASARRHSAESLQVLDLVARRIDQFFERRQASVEAFSDELFGLRGKWRALFWSREDFESHVRRRFEAHLFRPEDFEREVLGPVREDLAFAIDASEAGLASDLNQWARADRPGVGTPDVRPALSRMVSGLVIDDLGLNVASIAGSEAAVMASAAILTRAGILGTSVAAGAGSSWATLGIGLVVGTVAGLAIDAAVGDELEEAARDAVRLELDGLRRRMMESKDGLWWEARRVLEAHARALERSAVRLVEGSRHGAGGA
jgi:hypothetical protein